MNKAKIPDPLLIEVGGGAEPLVCAPDKEHAKLLAWYILDANPYPRPNLIHANSWDMSVIPDNCVDRLHASHIMEHMPHRFAMKSLREFARVLKPGGLMEIYVPDLMYLSKRFVEHPDEYGVRLFYGESKEGFLYDSHVWGYTVDLMRKYLHECGIEAEPFNFYCARHDQGEVRVEWRKP